MMRRVMEGAYEDGEEAFRLGLGEDACPYPPRVGTRNRRLQWLRGLRNVSDLTAPLPEDREWVDAPPIGREIGE